MKSHYAGKEVQLKRQQLHREKAYTENTDMLGKGMPTGVCYYTYVDGPEVVTLSN